MLRTITHRLLLLPFLLVALSAIIFALLYLLPGDPARMMAGEFATAEAIQRIREQMGFDRPAIVQYLDYLGNLLQGDWGRSYMTRRSVLDDILTVFPKTIQLALVAELMSVLIGATLGVLAAVYRNRWPDRLLMMLAVLSLSLPLFWLALLLQILFSLQLQLLPPSGYGEGLSRYIILPALTLAIPSSGFLARITRAAMIDVSHADFLRTAYAKGANRTRVVLRHMIPNVLLPMISVIGADLARLFAGVLIIEVIFTWPGLGKYAFDALAQRDFPALQGSLNVLAASVLLISLLTDVLYTVADPRLRNAR